MRRPVDAERVRQLFRALAAATREPTRAYLTGGATAVLIGWRDSTVDVDVRFEPERDDVLRAVQRVKDELQINVELVAPDDFVPVPDGAPDRARFAFQEGSIAVYHFDLVAQALAKIERGHDRDLADVRAMLERHLITQDQLRRSFAESEPKLYRYPAIDPADFRRRLDAFLAHTA